MDKVWLSNLHGIQQRITTLGTSVKPKTKRFDRKSNQKRMKFSRYKFIRSYA